MGNTSTSPLDVDLSFLKGRRKNFQNFFLWTQKYLAYHKKTLIISPTKTVSLDGLPCSGWCDGSQIVIAVKSRWFEKVYVHEFAHMQQAVQEAECWKNCDKFWNDLQKQKLSLDSWQSTMDIIKLERDCERRALKLVVKYGLCDPERYAQEANMYLYYYHFVFTKKKWLYAMNKLYKSPLLKKMPKKLLTNKHFSKINMEMMLEFDRISKKK